MTRFGARSDPAVATRLRSGAEQTAHERTHAVMRRARKAADPAKSSEVKAAAADPHGMFDMSTP